MRLVIVRHADAGDRDEWAKTGQPDALRPLSDKGRRQMKSAADGLRVLIPECDVILTSPYTRAVQTAKIVSAAYGVDIEETATLAPGSAPDDFVHWLRERGSAGIVIAAGHEPHLGELTTWLMTGARESHVEFKKAAACLLEFQGQAKRGAAVLRWLIGPKELAALA